MKTTKIGIFSFWYNGEYLSMYLYCRAFQFPIDMHLEPEYWAETGQLDDVERHELNVLENELFTVHPKTGQLSPGDRTTVTVSYK